MSIPSEESAERLILQLILLCCVYMDKVRELVSGKKRRLIDPDFNLDLTYITPRIIAMSLPAEGFDKLYRNSGNDVAKYLNERHPEQYKCYNLAGIPYNYAKFDNRVMEFPWPDHHAPPVDLLFEACNDIALWLQTDPRNVAVIHCKAGKGRTGTLICCFLLFSGRFMIPDDALKYYRHQRFSEGGGVTHPSQRRYVNYFHQVLLGQVKSPTIKLLQKLTLRTFPHFSFGTKSNSSRPFVEILAGNQVLYSSKAANRDQQMKIVDEWEDLSTYDIPVPIGMVLSGDILCKLYHWGFMGIKKICRFTFNTAFIPSTRLEFPKGELDPDIFVNSKCCSDTFMVSLDFQEQCVCTSEMEVDQRCAECKRILAPEMRRWALISTILSPSRPHSLRDGSIALFGINEDNVDTVLNSLQ